MQNHSTQYFEFVELGFDIGDSDGDSGSVNGDEKDTEGKAVRIMIICRPWRVAVIF